MIEVEAIEKLSKRYSVSPDEFSKHGTALVIKEKKEIIRSKGLKFYQDMKPQLLKS